MQTSKDTILSKLENTRKDLLDLGLRNSLLNFRLNGARCVEVVDELPQQVFRVLVTEKKPMSMIGDNNNSLPIVKSTSNRFKKKVAAFVSDEHDNQESTSSSPLTRRNVKSVEADAMQVWLDEEQDRYTSDTKLQTRLTTEDLQKRLLRISYDARASIEERGVNILYLALGCLEWFEADSSNQMHRAPLILVPVELFRSDVRERFKLRYNEEELDLNLSLEAKLKADFAINLPSLKDDVEDLDLESYFEQIKQVVLPSQPNWRVNTLFISLGFFSFNKLLLFKDLEDKNWPISGVPSENNMLRGLFLGNLSENVTGFPLQENKNIDFQVAPNFLVMIMDADSTQIQAVHEVNRGRNLAIQGPPGTGKSQTITNLIANAVFKGQKVLFVSEKMAALDVVKRRLDDAGLGDLCLELHNQKANKKLVLQELSKTLNLKQQPEKNIAYEIPLIEAKREQLNSYCEAINTPFADTGYTPYQLQGEILQLQSQLDSSYNDKSRGEPKVINNKNWSQAHFWRLATLIDELVIVSRDVGSIEQHPFRATDCEILTPSQERELRQELLTAKSAAENLRTISNKVANTLQILALDSPWLLPPITPFILNAPDISGVNVAAPEWLDKAAEIATLLNTGIELNLHYQQHLSLVKPEAWAKNLKPLKTTLEKYGNKFWRNFSDPYTNALKELALLFQNQERVISKGNLKQQLDLLEIIETHQKQVAVIQQLDGLGAYLFRRYWQGVNSDWHLLLVLTAWIQQLQEAVRTGACPPTLPNIFMNLSSEGLRVLKQDLASMNEAVTAHISSIRSVTSKLHLDEQSRFDNKGPLLTQTFQSQLNTLQEWLDNYSQLNGFIAYNQIAKHCLQLGLGEFVQFVSEHKEANQYVRVLFRQIWFETILEQAYQKQPVLFKLNRLSHDKIVEEFRELDLKLLEFNRKQLSIQHRVAIEGLIPSMVPRSRTPLAPQLRLLMRESAKKTRHIPLRKLLKQATGIIQTLKPIFMMSPLSIATYLEPGAFNFDLVIFDEASQVRPADAFGAILRGKQLVVAGDEKQLPPTSFFERLAQIEATDEEDFELSELPEDIIVANNSGDFENILALVKSISKPQMLRWHYRSRHESLIAVSNSEFYDNKLIIFPSPDADKHETGLVYHYQPETFYDRSKSRTNQLEAEAVARAVIKHAQTYPNLTLGVATFSVSQREAIVDKLEALRRENPDCEHFFKEHPGEPFFIKNLENVQGDERDVIFISVGYGRDADGKVTMNFGPLTKSGGERRLNVLISRAKLRCEVFTNLSADDIDLSRTSSIGVQAFKVFLDYAKSGKLHEAIHEGAREPDSPFEIEVRQALVEKGYNVKMQVGQAGYFIDLAIVDPDKPGRYLLGIECDGASYHSALAARDRDRLRQQILENLGWHVHRIWSTDWFRNPNREIELLIQHIQSLTAANRAVANS